MANEEIPILFIDQEATDAWDLAQKRIDELFDADVNDQHYQLNFIRE